MEHVIQPEEEKRPYHSPARQRQAEETHRRILVAARELFASRGYARTTLETIAEAAGVSPKTVSAVVGSKTAILSELVNPDAFDIQIQHLFDQLRTSQEPVKRVELVVLITRRVYESLVSEFELLRTAGVVARELADLARQIEARRRQRQAYLIGDLHEQGVLRHDLSLEEATDVLWSLTSYDLYRMLVVERRWSAERYESWLTNLLTMHLLQPVNDNGALRRCGAVRDILQLTRKTQTHITSTNEEKEDKLIASRRYMQIRSVAHQSQQKNTVPLIYRFQRLFFAASIVLGTAAILVAAFANPPYYGSQQGIVSAVATNAMDSDLMDQTHLVAQLIAAYLLPLGFLAMAWLANRRAPWLASIGAFITLLGFLPLALYVGQDALFYDIARWGSNPQFVDLAQRWNSAGVMNYYGIVFGLGTVLGPTLLGIALWRSRAVPVWAAICLILSRLPVFVFNFVPYHVETAIVLTGVVLLFVGSIPAALAVLRMPHNESKLPKDHG